MRFWRLPCLAGLLLVVQAVSANAADIALCADVWCPYNCTPGTAQPGLAVEIAQRVFSSPASHVTYQEVNWARCVEDARSGRFSGVIGAIPSDAPDFIFPKTPIGVSGDAYAARKDENFRFTGPQSLDGKVLGVTRSYTFNGVIGAYVQAHRNDTSRIEFASGNGALKISLAKLAAGRVDVVVDDRNVLLNTVAELGLSGQVSVTAGLNVTPIYIAFPPSAREPATLAARLDAGMAAMKASGDLHAILSRYHVPDMP